MLESRLLNQDFLLPFFSDFLFFPRIVKKEEGLNPSDYWEVSLRLIEYDRVF
jgi:hypothetical protein